LTSLCVSRLRAEQRPAHAAYHRAWALQPTGREEHRHRSHFDDHDAGSAGTSNDQHEPGRPRQPHRRELVPVTQNELMADQTRAFRRTFAWGICDQHELSNGCVSAAAAHDATGLDSR
jgi:hypothetical protein